MAGTKEWHTGRTKECRLGAAKAAGATPVEISCQLFYIKPSKVSRKAGRSGAQVY
jgi:hypothetical protein